jgi:hypothetical protein
MWLLAKAHGATTLQELDLTNDTIKVVLPASGNAESLAQSASGVVGVGLDAAAAGALEILDGTSGATTSTVSVGAPVKGVSAGPVGATFYVLNGTGVSASVTPVDASTAKTSPSLPVPPDTTATVVDQAGHNLYALEENGSVTQVALQNGSVVSRFRTGKNTVALSIGPSSTKLYLLERSGAVSDVAVVNLATEQVITRLPAPRYCVGIQVSPDGDHIYDLVGTARYGNVQAFSLTS